MVIRYQMTDPDAALAEALRTLEAEFSLSALPGDGLRATYQKAVGSDAGYRILPSESGPMIEYGSLRDALRATGSVLAGAGGVEALEEGCPFKTFGIMVDCSRNAVMRVEHLEGWLRRLALLGFNMVMLYTEDTYQLEGEPLFGHQRGAYAAEELQRLDDYAQRLGIEMIPCIQTLGHLAQILKWNAYSEVKDTSGVLLAGEEKTYQLIEKMIRHWKGVFRSPRIHLGMDEAYSQGRGRYLDRFGYTDRFEIFCDHLDRVVGLCRKHGREPMIWSDMFFSIASATGDYYDPDAQVPAEIVQRIPREVGLVYWDYYHDNPAVYRHHIERHRALGSSPIMGSGVWTWHALWHATNYTETHAAACIEACREAGLEEIFFTMWSDDGAMCDFDSGFQGLTFVAELAYAGAVEPEAVAARFSAVCHGDYEASRAAGMLSLLDSAVDDPPLPVWAWPVLWDDPFLGLFWNSKKSPDLDVWGLALARFRGIAEALWPWADRAHDRTAGDLRHAWLLAEVLARKVDIRLRLEPAYADRDAEELRAIVAEIPALIELIEALDASWREQWLRRNKPFGLEVVQIRIAGLARRFREMGDRLTELLDGRIDRIEELDDQPAAPPEPRPKYDAVATACFPGP